MADQGLNSCKEPEYVRKIPDQLNVSQIILNFHAKQAPLPIDAQSNQGQSLIQLAYPTWNRR